MTFDPILRKFRTALGEIYGERLERVVLFGSRARGDARPDSDYDVAVFLEDLSDRWAEVNRLANIQLDFLDDTGALIRATPFPAGAHRDRSVIMCEIRREGVDL